MVPLPGRRGRFGFVHALFRSHRYDALPLRRRLELHARAAAALATRSDDPRMLSERARHACLAVPIGDARLAVDLSREAAHEAEHPTPTTKLPTHYRRGLDAARSLDPPDRRATLDLTVRLGAVLHRLGDPHGLPMLLHAAQRARDEGDRRGAGEGGHVVLAVRGESCGRQPRSRAGLPSSRTPSRILGEEPSAARAQLLIELANDEQRHADQRTDRTRPQGRSDGSRRRRPRTLSRRSFSLPGTSRTTPAASTSTSASGSISSTRSSPAEPGRKARRHRHPGLGPPPTR